MYYCENCRIKNKWPEAFTFSTGKCECCGASARCHDRPSKSLPRVERATPAAASAGAAGTIDTPSIDRWTFQVWKKPHADVVRDPDGELVKYADHLQHVAAARSECVSVIEEHVTELRAAAARIAELERAATAPVSAVPTAPLEEAKLLREAWTDYSGQPSPPETSDEMFDFAAGFQRGRATLPQSAGAPVSAAEPAMPLESEAHECAMQQEWWDEWKAAHPLYAKSSPANAALEAWMARAALAMRQPQPLPTTYRLVVAWESARMEPDPAGEWVKRADLAMGQALPELSPAELEILWIAKRRLVDMLIERGVNYGKCGAVSHYLNSVLNSVAAKQAGKE